MSKKIEAPSEPPERYNEEQTPTLESLTQAVKMQELYIGSLYMTVRDLYNAHTSIVQEQRMLLSQAQNINRGMSTLLEGPGSQVNILQGRVDKFETDLDELLKLLTEE